MIAISLATAAVASSVSLPIGRLLCRRGVGWLLALVPAGLFIAFLRFYATIEEGRTVTKRLPWELGAPRDARYYGRRAAALRADAEVRRPTHGLMQPLPNG